jgi:PBSX family phage terminase large subunit
VAPEAVNGFFRYEPHAKQRQWIDSYAREKLFGGAKRGGKSAAIAMHITLLSMAFPGNRGLLARKAMTDLLDSTIAEFQQIVNPDIYELKRGDRKIIFKTDPPSEVLYRGLGEEGEFEKAKSVTIGFLALDEPSEIPKSAFLQLNAQLTHVLPNGKRPPYMTILGCNPEPGWVKERYVDSIDPAHVYVQALPRDNPGLPGGWEAELRANNDEDWVRRYLDGSWDVFEGQIFTELSDRLHNLDNWTNLLADSDYEAWLAGLRMIGCIDHATTGITTYGQDGIDKDENMFSVDEYYRSNRLISEHAIDIKGMMGEYGPNDYTLIDPSTAAKTQQGPHELFSYLDEYHRNGIHAIPATRSAIEVGINLLKEFLHVNQNRRHPFTGEWGSPRWMISKSRCPNLWKELTELRKELLPAGGIRYLGSDHAIDTKRYVAMSRPKPAPQTQRDAKPLSNTVETLAARAAANFRRQFDKKATVIGADGRPVRKARTFF